MTLGAQGERRTKGFFTPYSLGASSATRSRSAQNSMYCPIKSEFMPMRAHGSASIMNSFSCSTASLMIACSSLSVSLCSSLE